MARKLSTAVLLGALGFGPTVSALGLGNAETGSALNEPLSARIPLLSVGAEELSSVNVSLASPQAFERAGMDRPFYLSQLKFEVKAGKDGQAFVHVTTQRPVKEPFLDFLVKVRWPQGQLVREYTMLLDPPVYASEQETAPAPAAVRSATTTAGTASKPAIDGTDLAAGGTPQAGGAGGAGETTYGPVSANETLYAIANRVRPGSVSVNQTMVALVRANPQAFDGNNMNALHQGAVLRVPARGEIAATTEAEAVAEVRRQWARWKAARQVAASEDTPAQQPADAAASVGQQAAAGDVQQTGGQLDIVAPEESEGEAATTSLAERDLAPSEDNIERLQRRLTMMDETTASLESENADLREQVASLKQALARLESAVNIQARNSVANVADPQSAASEPKVTTPTIAEDAAPSAEAALEGEFWSGEIVSVPTLAQQLESHASAAPQVVESGTPAAGESETQTNSEPQAQPQVEAASLQTQVMDVVQRVLNDPNALLYAGGAVALLLVLLLVVRQRGGNEEAAPAMPEPAVPEFKRAVAAAADDADDESRRPAASADPEASPLEEAELCVAYGRYEQAQDLLDRALGDNPLDKALRFKLLEVLAKRSDRTGFEAEAQVLHTQIEDDSDPVWQQTVALGREIAPEHWLFADGQDDENDDFALTESESGSEEASSAAGEEDLSFLLEESESQHYAAEEPEFDLDFALDDDQAADREGADEKPAVGAAADDVNFDLDDPMDVALADDRGVDFDLNDSDSSFDALAADLPGAEPPTKEDDDLNFQLPDDLGPAESETEHTAEVDDGLDFGDFSFHASSQEETEEGDDEVDFDEVSTKLDLARAYLDMGDAEGARGLLDEVSEEGDDAQKQEAGELLQRAAS